MYFAYGYQLCLISGDHFTETGHQEVISEENEFETLFIYARK